MFSTTLRLSDELAVFIQEAARARSLSLNAYLSSLIGERLADERKRRLARDWAAYAADPSAQDVDYALGAQAELAAEPRCSPWTRRG